MKLLIAALLALLFSPTAFAQAPCGDARAQTFDGEKPFAGASISYALTRDCANLVLYRLTPKHAPRPLTKEQRQARVADDRPQTGAPHFYARIQKQLGYSKDPPIPPMWADQKSCPALLPAIEALERAIAPHFTGPGPVRGGGMSFTTDGAGVEVWAAGSLYPSDNISHKYAMSFNTNLGTPTADWLEATLISLQPCLSPTQPTPDTPVP